MTNSKLLERLKDLTRRTDKVDKEHIKALRKVLRKLKKRQQKLADERLEVESDRERQKIDQEIQVIQFQRSKGVEIYKRLKKEREERKQDRL